MRKKKIALYLAISILVLSLISTLFLNEGLAGQVTTVITVITALIGAIALFIQFKRDKDVNQANFIMEYDKFFHETTGDDEVMAALEEYQAGNKKALTKEMKLGIINYLVWCESLSVLIQREVMDFDTIDNIYSYRFFVIVNNKWIQKNELVPCAEYYKGVYYLHYAWTKYKKKTHQPILNEEASLANVENYMEYVKKGNMYNKSIH